MLEDTKDMTQTSKETPKDKVGETTIEKVATKSEKSMKVSPTSVKSSELVETKKLTENELATLDYADFSTPARMMALADVLCKSSLSPLKKKEDVVMALMTGKELGLPFITSLSQIYPINNRPTLGVHIQKAILLKNGVIFNKTEDSIELYLFVKKGTDGKPVMNGNKPVVLCTGKPIEEQPKDSLKSVVGFRTTYKFERELKQPSGNYKTITAYGSFSTIEAQTAELLDKDVWKKYYKRMLDARAFTNGAREIADDLLLGMYSPNELSSDFYINENGEEVHNAQVIN